MHDVFGGIFGVDRLESAGADMQHHFGALHPFALQSPQQLRREVQSGCWSSDRTWLPRKDGLITLDIRRFIGAFDVRRQRNVSMPFDRLPVWRELRALPLEQQKARLRDPELRRRLVEAARERDERRPIGAEARLGSYEWIFVMDTPEGPYRSVAAVARERGLDPVEAIIDLALEKDLDRFFLQPIANENQEHALELMKHPRTVVTFSDSGAHVSQIMDASLQTHLLSYWVRARQALPLEQAVRMLSFEPATHWGFADRGDRGERRGRAARREAHGGAAGTALAGRRSRAVARAAGRRGAGAPPAGARRQAAVVTFGKLIEDKRRRSLR